MLVCIIIQAGKLGFIISNRGCLQLLAKIRDIIAGCSPKSHVGKPCNLSGAEACSPQEGSVTGSSARMCVILLTRKSADTPVAEA